MDFWRKLNYLVPEPQCRTRGGRIVEWTDSRRQPTNPEILAVDIADIDIRDEVESFDKEVDALPPIMRAIYEELLTTNPGFRNRVKTRHDNR